MEHYIVLMETFMKDVGKMIGQMGTESILMHQDQNIQDTGKMINSMVMGLKNGKMGKSMKDNTKMGLKQEKENCTFVTEMSMRVISLKMNYMEKENIYGKRKKSMLGNGKIIKCMGSAKLNGKMGGSIVGNIRMMKKMVKVLLFGLTVELM